MIAIHTGFNVITVKIETLHDLHTYINLNEVANLFESSNIIFSFADYYCRSVLSSNTCMDNVLLIDVITLKCHSNA